MENFSSKFVKNAAKTAQTACVNIGRNNFKLDNFYLGLYKLFFLDDIIMFIIIPCLICC